MIYKNKADILLIICPMWDTLMPPLGIGYLASYLESKGIAADILDMNIEIYAKLEPTRKKLWKMENYNLWSLEGAFTKIYKRFEKDIEYYVKEILKREHKMVGFSVYAANVLFSIELATRLKRQKPDLFIIFGGPSCSFLHKHPEMPIRYMVSPKSQESLVRPGIIDAFVVGEGEEVLCNLINFYLSGELIPLPGVILYLKGKYTPFIPNFLIKDLNKISYPAWEKFPLKLYLHQGILPILFSRGCIKRCTFCNDWAIWNGKFRIRSALNIFEEMKTMAERFNAQIFLCNDLLFNADIKALKELAEYLINSDLNIQWAAQGIIRTDMSLKFLKKLKESGIFWITYGLESLSDSVLEKMNKGYSFKNIKEVLKNTKEAGIKVSVNFLVGFPNETREDFCATKNRLVLIEKHIDQVSSLNPCNITMGSALERFPEKFSIKFPKGTSCYWESLGGENNYKIRKKRAKELFKFIKEKGIKVCYMGI